MSDLSERAQRRVVGICGNLQRPSKSRALVTVMVESIAMHYGVATEIVCAILDLAPWLDNMSKAADMTCEGRGASPI